MSEKCLCHSLVIYNEKELTVICNLPGYEGLSFTRFVNSGDYVEKYPPPDNWRPAIVFPNNPDSDAIVNYQIGQTIYITCCLSGYGNIRFIPLNTNCFVQINPTNGEKAKVFMFSPQF